MEKNIEIRDLLVHLIQKTVPAEVFVGLVTAVGSETCTVSVDGAADLQNVRLRASVNGSGVGLFVLPKKDSYVVCAYLSGNMTEAVVLLYSEIDSLTYVVGEQSIALSADGVVFNGGENGGMIIYSELESRLKKIEMAFNDLVTKYNSHTHVTTCGAGAGSATATPLQNNSFEFADLSQLANEKVTH